MSLPRRFGKDQDRLEHGAGRYFRNGCQFHMRLFHQYVIGEIRLGISAPDQLYRGNRLGGIGQRLNRSAYRSNRRHWPIVPAESSTGRYIYRVLSIYLVNAFMIFQAWEKRHSAALGNRAHFIYIDISLLIAEITPHWSG